MGGFFLRTIFVFLLINGTHGMAQEKKVESTAFRLLLGGLLKSDVPEIGVDSLSELSNRKGVHFIDARERAEYEVSHLKDATWVGYDDFDMSRLQHIPKEDTLVVYCSIGKRSEDITRKLQQAGYNASNLYGGIFEWVNRQKPVYHEDDTTQKIHGYSKMWSVWLKKGDIVYK